MSEAHQNPVGSDPCEPSRREEPMLQGDAVQEVLARLARGEKIKAIARELGVDRHTVAAACSKCAGRSARGGPRRAGQQSQPAV